MMVNADLGTAQAGEIFLSLVRASAVERVSLLMVDALHFEPLVQAIPRGGFVGINNRTLGNTGLDE